MSIFAFVFLTACKDPSSLVGDSNIYANPIELEFEAISFDERISAESDMPQDEQDDIPKENPLEIIVRENSINIFMKRKSCR